MQQMLCQEILVHVGANMKPSKTNRNPALGQGAFSSFVNAMTSGYTAEVYTNGDLFLLTIYRWKDDVDGPALAV